MTALIKIGLVFFLVLILTFRKIPLWVSLLVGSLLLGLLFQLPLKTIALDLFAAAVDVKTLLLLGALFSILLFSNLLKETGRMDQIIEGFGHVFRDIRVVVALMPAIIGLMPLMGGALVSAPMVVEGSDELKLSPERRTFINYWFRHVWEYVLPTYPAFILAVTLTGIPVRQFGWMNLPLTVVAIVSGALLGFWGVQSGGVNRDGSFSKRCLLGNLSPFFVALLLVIAFKVELAYAFGLTILGMILLYRVPQKSLLSSLKGSLAWGLLMTVLVVMGFKRILESSQAIDSVAGFLSSSGFPLWLIAILIPLIAALMTGMTMAPAAISYPILIPLFQNDPKFVHYMSLALTSVVCGDLLSPFHLCLILTKDYFKADLKKVYHFLWAPVLLILVTALLMAFFR